MKNKSQKFTMMELLIVIALMALTLGLSVPAATAFRSGRGVFTQTTSSFCEFMANARRQAMASNMGVAVVKDDKDLEHFTLKTKTMNEEGELEEDQFPFRWIADQEFAVESNLTNEEEVLFFFYPDGTGVGKEFTIILGGFSAKFYLSPLTGTCLQEEEDIE